MFAQYITLEFVLVATRTSKRRTSQAKKEAGAVNCSGNSIREEDTQVRVYRCVHGASIGDVRHFTSETDLHRLCGTGCEDGNLETIEDNH